MLPHAQLDPELIRANKSWGKSLLANRRQGLPEPASTSTRKRLTYSHLGLILYRYGIWLAGPCCRPAPGRLSRHRLTSGGAYGDCSFERWRGRRRRPPHCLPSLRLQSRPASWSGHAACDASWATQSWIPSNQGREHTVSKGNAKKGAEPPCLIGRTKLRASAKARTQ